MYAFTSSKDKANLFARKFSANSTLNDMLHSPPDFKSVSQNRHHNELSLFFHLRDTSCTSDHSVPLCTSFLKRVVASISFFLQVLPWDMFPGSVISSSPWMFFEFLCQYAADKRNFYQTSFVLYVILLLCRLLSIRIQYSCI